MFGLTFEKLFLVAIIAGVLIGPQRLPAYAHQLRETVRGFRAFVDSSRARAEAELGDVSLTRAEWEALDLRRYDPRRIVRDALDDATRPTPGQPESLPTVEPQSPAHPAHPAVPAAGNTAADPRRADQAAQVALLAEAARVRPGQRFVVTGSAAHPRRVAIASLPTDDPRRIAATSLGDPGAGAEAPVVEGASDTR